MKFLADTLQSVGKDLCQLNWVWLSGSVLLLAFEREFGFHNGFIAGEAGVQECAFGGGAFKVEC